MEKLKTLKDIRKLFEEEDGYDYDEYLKAEAVKWVKQLLTSSKDYKETEGTNFWFRGKADMLMCFFNLTEEDLKEKNK